MYHSAKLFPNYKMQIFIFEKCRKMKYNYKWVKTTLLYSRASIEYGVFNKQLTKQRKINGYKIIITYIFIGQLILTNTKLESTGLEENH